MFNAFYHLVPQGKTYDRRPVGIPDLNRFIQQQRPDFWLSPIPADLKTPYTLLIADWRAPYWSDLQIIAIQTKLKHLLDLGFDIYLWQDGLLQPCLVDTLPSLNDYSVRRAILPCDFKTVRDAAATQYRLAYDDVLILDDYWVDYMLGDDAFPPSTRVLKLRDVTLFYASPYVFLEKELKTSLSMLQDASPPLQGILIDEFGANAKTALDLINNSEHRDLIQTVHYTSATLSDNDAKKLLKNNSITGENGFVLTLDILQTLTRVRFINIEKETLLSMLVCLPLLKSISFQNQVDLSFLVDMPEHAFGKLEEFDLNVALDEPNPFNADQLKGLFQSVPRVRAIYFTSNRGVGSGYFPCFPFLPDSLPNLEVFRLLIRNHLELSTLIEAAPQLKKIDLGRYGSIREFKSAQENFPLEVLVLDQAGKINGDCLSRLLSKTTNLGILDFRGDLEGEITLSPRCLLKLKRIRLNESLIDLKNLNVLLQASPHVQDLDIHFSKAARLEGELDIPLLSDLKTLAIRSGFADAENLWRFLRATPSLETLDMGTISELRIEAELVPLLKLKHIVIKGSKVIETVNQFINYMPNVERIALGKSDSPGVLITGISPLLKLKILDVTNGMTAEQLGALLLIAPHLETLNLVEYTCTGTLTLDANSLLSIKTIALMNSTITSSFRAILKAAAPYAEFIGEYNPSLRATEIPDSRRTHQAGFGEATSIESVGLGQTESSQYPKNTTRASPVHRYPHVAHLAGMNTMDADTQYSPSTMSTFKIEQAFYPIGTYKIESNTHVRQDVYQQLVLNPSPCLLKNAFRFVKAADAGLSSSQISLLSGKVYEQGVKLGANVYGQCTLELSNVWQALPSLSSQEVMIGYKVTPVVEVEIAYSARDNLYYIKSTEPGCVHIEFLLREPPRPAIPAVLQALMKEFVCWPSENVAALILPAAFSGEDCLNAMEAQQKGACRHRVAIMQRRLEKDAYQIRAVFNGCHAFSEVYMEGHWHTCDWGGYNANLEIDHHHAPFGTREATSIPLLFPSAATETMSSSAEDSEVSSTPKPAEASPTIKPLSATEEAVVVKATDMPKEALQAPCFSPSVIALIEASLTPSKAVLGKETVAAYCQRLMGRQERRQLIECEDERSIAGLSAGLVSYGEATGRAVFIVYEPSDLICSSPYLRPIEGSDRAILTKGPGGALYTFIKSHPTGVLVIHYESFKSQDWVQFNALMDDGTRYADGTPLGDEMQVIGLWHRGAMYVPGSDILGRADVKERCTVPKAVLETAIALLPAHCPATLKREEIQSFCLYHALDWKERLEGRYVPVGQGFQYEAGLLSTMDSSKPLVIDHGLWQDEAFCRFWDRYRKAHPAIQVYRGNEEYNWARWASLVSLTNVKGYPLNQATFPLFFQQYSVSNEGYLVYDAGLVTRAADSLSVYLTETLSDDAWAMLLDACLSKGLSLAVAVAPTATLPSLLSLACPASEAVWDETAFVIESTEVCSSVALLQKKHPEALVLDISECHDDALLMTLTPSLVEEGEVVRLQFKTRQGAVLSALEAGQAVILFGTLTTALASELAPFLLTKPHPFYVVSTDTSTLSYLPRYKETITPAIKADLLDEMASTLSPFIKSDTLETLRAKKRFIEAGGDIAEWNRPYVDERTSVSEDDFMARRKASIEAVLAREPFVILSGLSGTGKTTFVRQYYQGEGMALYEGDILAWAEDRSGMRPILFLDEANLSGTNWRLFSGLFHSSPGLLWEGKWYSLTPKHHVIFAMNPNFYKGGRQVVSLFSDYAHHNMVVFDPLPPVVLLENILNPVWEGHVLSSQREALNTLFLELYHFLCEASTTDVLISPREIQMMALLTGSYCHGKDVDAMGVALFMARTLALPLVPIELRDIFNRRWKEQPLALNQRDYGDFILTPSRYEVALLLDEYITLAEKRREARNDVQRYGGLGGLILEGEPGQGKSHLMIAALGARGYEEVKPDAPFPNKPYYRMPASMALEEKEGLFIKAFDEGALVLVDEINSVRLPLLLLNALLMGRTPAGKRPTTPGFMLLGTQNPITMSGRFSIDTALARRLTTQVLVPYPKAEMEMLLLHLGLAQQEACYLIERYNHYHAAADTNQLPPPTFRSLKRLAKQLVKGHEKALLAAPIHRHLASVHPVDSLVLPSQTIEPNTVLYQALQSLKTAYEAFQWWNPKRWFFPSALGRALRAWSGQSNPAALDVLVKTYEQSRSLFKSRYACLRVFKQQLAMASSQESSVTSSYKKMSTEWKTSSGSTVTNTDTLIAHHGAVLPSSRSTGSCKESSSEVSRPSFPRLG